MSLNPVAIIIVLHGVVFIGVLGLAKAFLSLPFSVYSTFVIESRFGFNTTTPGVFVSDRVKQLFLAALIGGPLFGRYPGFFCVRRRVFWMLGAAVAQAGLLFYVLLNYSHPPIVERLEVIDRCAAGDDVTKNEHVFSVLLYAG